jgi:hypothetical protein
MLLLSERIFLALFCLFRVLGLVFVLEILLRIIRKKDFRHKKKLNNGNSL